jgi:hypothetical protein
MSLGAQNVAGKLLTATGKFYFILGFHYNDKTSTSYSRIC